MPNLGRSLINDKFRPERGSEGKFGPERDDKFRPELSEGKFGPERDDKFRPERDETTGVAAA
jgi:hypothetical protein